MSQKAGIRLFTLSNRNGLEVEISDYGGTVVALRAPDRHWKFEDLVLGFDTPEGYLGPHPYFGGIIGRFGNRIADGRFPLDGHEYVLVRNDGRNHLHGGDRGFNRRVWAASAHSESAGPSLILRYTSADGEEGYPGRVDCEVTYSVTTDNEFRIDYAATTDRSTIINLTHHSYFNLTGRVDSDILGHELFVDADTYTPVDESLIPTGEIRSVADTAFDFREPTPIGARIGGMDAQLAVGHGYDHNFVLNVVPSAQSGNDLRRAACLLEPVSGRAMDVLTTEPGLQVYSGGALDGTVVGKGGRPYRRHAGLCLETQHFPDSPNHSSFPSVRLDPGETYRSTTVYRFSVAAQTSG
jgi:aldose 1-epimerase